jgi:hypothetical protein
MGAYIPTKGSCGKIKTPHAKPQTHEEARRNAKGKPFRCLEIFAYFAPLRETGLFIHGLIHRFKASGRTRHPRLEAAQLATEG